MFAGALAALFLSASVAAQSTPSVVCVAGQCLQGVSNISIGVTLSAAGAPASLLLLPGQYSSNTNPQLLHNVLTSSSASLTPSPGFPNTTSVSLPLNVALQPGMSIYSRPRFSGSPSFIPLPTSRVGNNSLALPAQALAISTNTWAAVTSGSSPSRMIIWDSIPDVSQLPSGSGQLTLVDLQSAACSPPCSGAGVCSPSGTCTCPKGFTGSSCETCANGFFGPSCSPCPAGCTTCDDGLSGSGRCLTQTVSNPPSSCNCLNGQCGSGGQCACNAGWTASSNGTQCAQCAPGFFLTSDGNCQVCKLGCGQCADQSGTCIACKSGFTLDANDRTQCLPPQTTTTSGQVCPDGSFSGGASCTPCSPECRTCSGSTSNDCIICGVGRYSMNGTCVPTDGNGVCQGSSMVADNNKNECDSCPSKCTKCGIPSFSVASTISQLQCTACLPGFVLSKGQCVSSCPSGTFLSPQDNLTCTACDSSCGTCAGSATFCLTCTNNQLAFQGKCTSSCPSNAFSSSGSCTTCHPDCATCSGGAFTQCSSCPPSRPVLSNGRCLPTCSKNQYFDTNSAGCQSCDSSCSSCSGSGPSSCLACSGPNDVLQNGRCVPATCTGGTTVIPGMGLCLSDIVTVAQSSGSTTQPPPTLPGLTNPTTTVKPRLTWWQILLMTLGCAFIVLVALLCWRRRARKIRVQQTAVFAQSKGLDKPSWRMRLARFRDRLFRRKPHHRVYVETPDDLERMKRLDDGPFVTARFVTDYERGEGKAAFRSGEQESLRTNRLSDSSYYSQITGQPRRTPEPRQPVKRVPVPTHKYNLASRFSASTLFSGSSAHTREELPPIPSAGQSEAEMYALSIRDKGEPANWLQPTYTGSSTGSRSRNPFLKEKDKASLL